ncbi:MAG: Type 1 glutamine amidotransferase-like domain-containing protein [Geobacteraceae bacterium]|nr:Type 1 glutamine amidotransferase-like domain-containing protein [Geobacteraceae bacterium]
MSLVFLSDQLTRDNDETDYAIMSLLEERNNHTIFYIPSQADKERFFYSRAVSYYSRFGIRVLDYFDLENEYDAKRIDELFQAGAVHLSGGSTFHFLQSLQRRGFLSVLKKYAANGGTLIGVSAGALLMTPHIEASLVYGDPFIEGIDTRALNLVDWEFFPHINSLITEEKIIAYSRQSGKRILSCEDGDGIIVSEKGTQYIGIVREYYKGALQPSRVRKYRDTIEWH